MAMFLIKSKVVMEIQEIIEAPNEKEAQEKVTQGIVVKKSVLEATALSLKEVPEIQEEDVLKQIYPLRGLVIR